MMMPKLPVLVLRSFASLHNSASIVKAVAYVGFFNGGFSDVTS